MRIKTNYPPAPANHNCNFIIRFINRGFCLYDLFMQVCKQHLSALKFSKTTGCLIIGFMFLLSLVPLFLISRYNYPSADDFSFGILTHDTWAETHNIWLVLKAGFHQAYITYFDWQGSYSAIFLMSLQPAIFGNVFYRIVPFLMLFALISSSLYLWKVILVDWLKSDIFTWLLVALTSLYMSIQYLHSPVEGFYWYNGSVYYTFYYSCSLVLYAFILKSVWGNQKPRVFQYILLFIFSLFIAGGNLVTILLSLLLVFALYLYSLYWKLPKKIILFCLFTLAAGFVINVVAPGNAVRQTFAQNTPMLKTILVSFYYSLSLIVRDYTTVPTLIILFLLVQPLYKLASSINYSFRRPWLFVFLSFCIFTAQVTPPFYAMSNTGPGRLLNIIYFSYWWFIILNLIYILGWLNHRIKSRAEMYSRANLHTTLRPYLVVGYFILVFFFLWINLRNETTSFSASKSLLSGEAALYGKEMSERIRLYEGDEEILCVDKLSVTPNVVFWKDIEADSCLFRNLCLARYYHKTAISTKE